MLTRLFQKTNCGFGNTYKKGAAILWIKLVQCKRYQSTSIFLFFFYCKNRSVIQLNDADTLNEMKA